ncbi:Galactoside 2-alpha-L-fucosyltransferase [Linum perenne]
MLTEWFLLNRTCPSARQYTYSEMPNAFIWDKQASQWTPRKKGFAIGRVRSIPPRAGDVFYLRMLLSKIPGALSFEHLRTVHGVVYKDYQEACQALGLLSNDNEWNSVMAEVSQWAMAPLIRSTFVALLVFCEVTTPLILFENWWVSMADDFNHRMQNRSDDPHLEPSPVLLRNEVLQNLQALLQNYSSSLAHYGLPMPTHWTSQLATDDLISQQLQYDTSVEARLYNSYEVLLNTCQRTAHDAVVSALSSSNGKLFFLYGHGGTGKTYLYNCLLSKVRSEGKIALVVASSGIAATLLPGGVTAHSRFRIPLDVDSTSTCTIKKGTSLARLMKSASLIVWDEAPMVHRLSFEAVDRTLCDIMDTPTEGVNYKPFGGKTVLLGGDFRQTLPIVVNGGREDNLNASLTRSYLWNHCTLLELKTNMRIIDSTINAAPIFEGLSFPEWVLAIGDGRIPTFACQNNSFADWINIPPCFLLPTSDNPIAAIVNCVYTDLSANFQSVAYIRTRAIVTPTNQTVSSINDYVLSQIPGHTAMDKRQGFVASQRFIAAMAVCFLVFPVLVIVIPGIYKKSSFFDEIGRLYTPHPVAEQALNLTGSSSDFVKTNHTSGSGDGKLRKEDYAHQLFDGLPAPGFDDKSCLSRLERQIYRKSGTQRKPSAYLQSKLRSYEDLHRRCGPSTGSYRRAIEAIRSGDINTSSTSCKYVLWTPVHGMGNRIVSLASTFLYALLTNRVLLADLGKDMTDLFCEPFMGSSWVLPREFPLKKKFSTGKFRFDHSVGRALKNGTLKVTEGSPEAPPFLFLNIYKGNDPGDYCFYCDQSHSFLRRIPWLIMVSDQYFAPSFFLIPSFKQKANRLFPKKESVFYHLVNYLLHPSNQAWEMITRFYKANLAGANERVGLQVRLFKAGFRQSSILTDQLLACLVNQNLIPKIDNQKAGTSPLGNQTIKAVLITSLYPQFYQNLSSMYLNKPTVTGEAISFYQPSHEEKQKFGDSDQNMKALVEIYLLSMCEKLVISSKSTFGYIAQGLGDTKAWVLRRPGHGAEDPCVRDLSTEPCFHYPPMRSCNVDSNKNNNRYVDVAYHVPYMKHCKDQKIGVKLVDVHKEL